MSWKLARSFMANAILSTISSTSSRYAPRKLIYPLKNGTWLFSGQFSQMRLQSVHCCGWLVCWVGGWVDGWLAGWMVGCLVGLFVGWLRTMIDAIAAVPDHQWRQTIILTTVVENHHGDKQWIKNDAAVVLLVLSCSLMTCRRSLWNAAKSWGTKPSKILRWQEKSIIPRPVVFQSPTSWGVDILSVQDFSITNNHLSELDDNILSL